MISTTKDVTGHSGATHYWYNPNGGKTFTLEMTGSESYELDFEGNGQNGNYDHWQNNVAGTYAKSEWGSDENGDFSEDSGDNYTADLSNQGNDVAGIVGFSSIGTRYQFLELFVAGGDADTDVNGGQFITSIDGFPVQRVNPIYRPTGTREIAGDIQNKYCFTGDTLVTLVTGEKGAIEQLKAGMEVRAAHEGDPEGKPRGCKIEEVFKNPPAEIWEVHLAGGQVLRTTAGHLVYIKTLGWTIVSDLKPGDLFRTEQGEGLRVEKVVNTKRMEPVYNLRVAECHTYFVSADESSPAILVHNASWNPLTWGWVQTLVDIDNDVKGFFYHWPEAYIETASSGEQISSAAGYSDAFTDKMLLGYGSRFGAQYGQDTAYVGGHVVGSVAGFVENAAIMVSGVGGVVKGVQSVAATGGMLQIGTAALATGESIPVIIVNGKAVAATAQTLAAAGVSADGIANIMKGASTGDGGGAARNALPTSASQMGHIFRDAEGHLSDTAANRQLLQDVANDARSTLGMDQFGKTWSARILPDGTQVWTTTRNGVITNGGLNQTPQVFNPQTGLSASIKPGG